jgi:hypothetical protein
MKKSIMLSSIKRGTTFGGIGVSFGCTNAIFKNCIFSSKE